MVEDKVKEQSVFETDSDHRELYHNQSPMLLVRGRQLQYQFIHQQVRARNPSSPQAIDPRALRRNLGLPHMSQRVQT